MRIQTWLAARRDRQAMAQLRRQFAKSGFNLNEWTNAEIEAGLMQTRGRPMGSAAGVTANEAGALLDVLMKGSKK